jgi:two-component system chemotaxis response regulator CheB
MIKVLVVDDSVTTQIILSQILNSDPKIRVIATASDGAQALQCIAREKPDIITMDVHMPGMNGLEATRIIMETSPLPIIICSASWDATNTAVAFQFMEAGAIALIGKPASPRHAEYQQLSAQLIDTVKMMSEIKVVKRRRRFTAASSAAMPDTPAQVKASPRSIIALGASTGGPPAIKTILEGLPEDFSLPILIVQHIAEGFLPGFVTWLGKSTKLVVKQGAHNEMPLAAHIYLAPAGSHMGIADGGRIVLSESPPEHGVQPSVSVLFRSLALHAKSRAVGILLTGMGVDGALELKAMRDAGALTIAQDKESSIVYGMPGEAVKLGAATMVLPPEQICKTILSVALKSRIR